jgi:hypothetical protein
MSVNRIPLLAIGAVLCLVWGCAASRLGAGSKAPTAAQKAALEEMLATERAFAQLAAEKGTNAAFLANIADDGILFRPGPIKGKDYLAGSPDSPGVLSWRPIRAGIDHTGKLGWTCGPWEFRKDAADQKPVATGSFFTLWRRDREGQFQFVLDAGVSHPPVEGGEVEHFAASPAGAALDGSPETALRFAMAELTLAQAAADGDPSAFYRDKAAPELVVLREGSAPLEGPAALQILETGLPGTTLGESRSGHSVTGSDLTFFYGPYTRSRLSGLTEQGYYVRIWRVDGRGKVLLVLDAELPLPPAEKR